MDKVLDNKMTAASKKQKFVLTLLKAGFSLANAPNLLELKKRFHEDLDMAYLLSYFLQVTPE